MPWRPPRGSSSFKFSCGPRNALDKPRVAELMDLPSDLPDLPSELPALTPSQNAGETPPSTSGKVPRRRKLTHTPDLPAELPDLFLPDTNPERAISDTGLAGQGQFSTPLSKAEKSAPGAKAKAAPKKRVLKKPAATNAGPNDCTLEKPAEPNAPPKGRKPKELATPKALPKDCKSKAPKKRKTSGVKKRPASA